MVLKLNLPNRTAFVVVGRMGELKLSIADVAKRLGTSYEYVRRIAKGKAVPSESMVKALAGVLRMDATELERHATADRIRFKFGTIPLELAGKNPELEPLERIWNLLTKEHKLDLIAQAQVWAERDREAANERRDSKRQRGAPKVS